ncbi:MAG: hypothetical protein GYB67_04405, partial [Chloroflexi bacterium]|nr:hypothetical protein [Chloroflexota bacterium]
TVARLKTAKHTPEVEAFLTQHADLRLPPVQVTAFHLVASALSPQGPTYTNRADYPLTHPPESID